MQPKVANGRIVVPPLERAIPIVRGALVVVREDLLGSLDFEEGSAAIAERALVGVEQTGELTEVRLCLHRRRALVELQRSVVLIVA